MKKGKLILMLSFFSVLLCVSIVLGFTWAVFTNETRVSIGLHSGAVQMDAYITNLNLYSVKECKEDLTDTEIVKDKNGKTYTYEKRSKQFANGGTAELTDKLLVFKNLCPGDRVDFDIELKNVGEISIQYNTIISLVDQVENALFNAMDINITTGEEAAELSPFRTGPSSLRTGWKSLGLNQENKVHVSFVLSINADNIYQNMEAKFKCSLSGIQDLGDYSSMANIFDREGNPVLTEDGKPIIVDSLKDAIEKTPNDGTIDIIRGAERAANENLTIDKSITLQSADSEMKNFSNLHISVTNGASVKIKDLSLKGDTFIDISTATALSLDNCTFDITPSRLFDESTREYLNYAAGIVSTGVQQLGIQFTCKNSNFNSSDTESLAVYLLGALSAESAIENNTFGNTTFVYKNAPLYLSGVASLNFDIAKIYLRDNKFYINNDACVVTLHQNGGSPFYLDSERNVIMGGKSLVHMDASFAVIVMDNDSTIQGESLTFANLGAEETTIFRALNTLVNEDGKFVSGTFKLSENFSEADFRETFVYRLALDNNIILE